MMVYKISRYYFCKSCDYFRHPPERMESKVNSRIVKIYAANSSKVKKGTILAILESTANFQDVLTLTKQSTQLTQIIKTLVFHLTN